MLLDDQIDPDEILRDVDEANAYNFDLDEVRELKFGTIHDENENFKDMAGDFINTDDSSYLPVD